jgi:hypothetical protein
MSSARYVVPLALFVTSIDLLVMQLLAIGNRWRLVHDHPPAIAPGYEMRVALYGVLVFAAAILLRWARVSKSRSVHATIVTLFVLLVARALLFGVFYPWGARDVAEFAAAKGAVEIVAGQGQRYYETNGRVAASLADLDLPTNVTRDPWGFTLGYVRSGNGFRVFVRGAPAYISADERMAQGLVKDVTFNRDVVRTRESHRAGRDLH